MEPIELVFFRALSRFIRECNPGEEVRLLDSEFIAPKGPYTAIKITDIDPVSWTRGQETAPDETGRTASYSNYLAICSFYIYGRFSMSRGQSIAVGFRERLTKQVLKEHGLSYSESTTVRNASRAVSQNKMEERAQFSASFYFTQGGVDRGGDDPQIIETINTIASPEFFINNPTLSLDFSNLEYEVYEEGEGSLIKPDGGVIRVGTSSYYDF